MRSLLFRSLTSIASAIFALSAYAQDQCDYTAQCKTQYGNQATDCANSRSLFSVCMCGSVPCEDSEEPGQPDENLLMVPGFIQAEDYHRYWDSTADNLGGAYREDGVDIQDSSDNGGQYNVGWTATNEWLEFDIHVEQAGVYRANVRVASAPGGGQYTVEIDGQTRGSAMSVPATGGWQQWVTQSLDLGQLTQGQHTLRLQIQAGNFNINWLELRPLTDTGSGEMIGRFDTGKDLFLANFDSKPDPDDIHAVAAVATVLKDARFSNVNYFAVAGAYGDQGGDFIEADYLFDLAFGANGWTNAHVNYNGALDTVFNKVKSALNAGGDIWIAEAGQSDFSADLVRRVKAQLPSVNTNGRIHIIQHSNWNQDHTTPGDLSYVRNNTDYQKISDGNSTGNGTPGFNNKNTSHWNRVLNHNEVGVIWTEAKRVADHSIDNHVGWKNPSIAAGGMDFSDTVETTWIFGFNSVGNIGGFFDEFL
ncbi:carbohydrate-binding protein [Microbulbifer elongatus]|uniref:Carbohydrate-binding protein n=1 Tax=Microbulbifer elongatus TaxID=86173 RepID=A0ABT1P1M1_9GAMM|nr:carbohydrate-binding protein [Microbulbifer elongatus]MCQ3830021.1 carbohydrate-binding protein [Microbulbifer elongatus]